MIRLATADDREAFSILWAEFLRDANKAGADTLPTQRNLETCECLFDQYISGELDGIIYLAIQFDGDLAGVTMSGEAAIPQAFDSSYGRIAIGWGTYVRESQRGNGWSRMLRLKMLEACTELGFDVVTGPIAFTNEASLESCKKLGIDTPSVVAVKRLGGN